MEDGIIEVDSQFGKELGFTYDQFTRTSYLWKSGQTIYISAIEACERGKGNLRRLFQAIEAKGLTIKVPTPFRRMEEILRKQGFKHTVEDGPDMPGVEVWVKEAKP
jgi:hypothetical protein